MVKRKKVEFKCENCYPNNKFETNDWVATTVKEDNEPHGVCLVRVEARCPKCNRYVIKMHSLADIFYMLMEE